MMTMPFHMAGMALPIAPELPDLLRSVVREQQIYLTHLSPLTFNFRSPGYSAETGGVHPVELRLNRGLHGWGPLPCVDTRELFALWQSNFISYTQLGYFTITVSGK
ncbi:DUF2787 family protein [Aeromonas veronii]|uniref:DUF2787 family protein n=1 Tax=Aeromonas veronii TaxID=654 RepID=UPI00143193E2|nr:DUF2787 domain-containing protein [Aeromonas veronii]